MAPACGVSDLQFEYSLNDLLKVGISWHFCLGSSVLLLPQNMQVKVAEGHVCIESFPLGGSDGGKVEVWFQEGLLQYSFEDSSFNKN